MSEVGRFTSVANDEVRPDPVIRLSGITLHITSRKKAERGTRGAFSVRVHVIIMFFWLPIDGVNEFLNAQGTFTDSRNWLSR
ncbi:hypothetical protein Ga0123461_0747 [Mariprofundus aestuarium]|uniref:Uncharacterized protein n=1 Tax=Mariprofundus aestuarium TaxID=1921086 RepID=A0A2K8L041_MARES|nr:hypothetical protein Ga0123461_0747 [Mariprofundus aestuarium]